MIILDAMPHPMTPLVGVISLETIMPDEVRHAVTPWLMKWAHLVPAWLHKLDVFWTEADTCAASTTTHYDYRSASLTIHPNFISRPDCREINIVHELVHLSTEPLFNAFVDIRDALERINPDLGKLVREQVRHANEQVTCDLAAMIMRVHSQAGGGP